MQILKDEVKNKIIDAAVEEFLVNGYLSSSMRTIAAQAGITIGNIYSYFSSKEDLFENVVSPAWEALDMLMSMSFPVNEGNSENLLDIANYICKVFMANQERFFILINGSSASKFESTKEKIIDFVGKRIKEEYNTKLNGGEMDALLAKAMASALLAGFLTVFNHFGGDEQRLTKLIHELLFALMGNIQHKQ